MLPLPQCAIPPAAMAEELEATRRKRKLTNHWEQAEVAAASSESPRPPATPDFKPESPGPVAPETLTATAVAGEKGHTRKKQEVAAAFPLVEEAVPMEETKKCKRSRHVEAAAIPSPSAATAHILEVAENGAAGRKERRQGKVVQEQSGQLPFPIDVHPQGGKPAANGGVSDSQFVLRNRFGAVRVLSKNKLLKHRINLVKQLPNPKVFIPTIVNPNSIDQDPKYSSPYGGIFDQFCYKPDRQQGRNAPSLPQTPDPPARPLPRDHLPSRSSQVTANVTFMNAKTTTSKTKQTRSASASGLQEEVNLEGKNMPEENMSSMKKPRSPAPLLSAAEKDPKYSSPYGGIFDQFCYKPDRQQGRNAPSLPQTPDPPARPLPRDHLPSRSSQVTANETFMNAKTTTSNTKQTHSASASGLQEEVNLEGKNMPEENMSSMKKPRNPAPLLSAAEKRPKYSSPYGGIFDQFCYKPDRQQGRNAPSLPQTPDPPAWPLPRDHLPSRSSQVTANETFMDAKTTTSNTKQQRLATASGLQEEVNLEGKKIPEKNMSSMKKPRNPAPLLSSAEKDPKYASPYGAIFDQFSYKPDRQQGRNAPSLPETPHRPARPLPRDHLPSRFSQITANETFMGAKTTTSIRKQPHSASASASGPQEEIKVEGKKMPEKKPRKPAPVLRAAEMRSEMYRRLPLNQLVRPPRSPHKLLQEKYASDPWKVMVICTLLNATQGKQVRKKVKGFFRRYPDAQTAYTADPEKMAEYLAPLGLQRVKAKRIQKFSMAYLQEEWTYVTELYGVGKYAADAYAIFCAGRATDVVPQDHKLVDYWKYVCFELPLIQASQNAQDVGVTRQGNFAPWVKQVAVRC